MNILDVIFSAILLMIFRDDKSSLLIILAVLCMVTFLRLSGLIIDVTKDLKDIKTLTQVKNIDDKYNNLGGK